jgi:phytanoyl-CoA dioxygenase PhyH
MTGIDKAALAEFREQGYVVIPGVLDERQLALGRRVVAAMLTAEPPPAGQPGPYFLWPRFALPGECGHDHGLLRFYRTSGVADLAAALLEAPPDAPAFAQVAVTIAPWAHRPGGPHVDGLSPPEADGRPGTFSLLAGVWLTDHSEPDRGNLWVWPGSHLRFGAYLAERGADALTRLAPASYPPVALSSPVQVTGPAGSVLFAHYLLGHNIGGHAGPAGERQVVYYRLQAHGHRDRWRAAVTDPLSEFRLP